MQENAANRFTSRIVLNAVSVAVSAAACAGNLAPGNIAGMAPTSRSPQIMLYVSQPLWSPGTSSRVYGLRIEEVRGQPTSPQSAAVGSLRRSELLDLQIAPHWYSRVAFGRRLIWDFTRKGFGPQSSLSIVLPIKSATLPDPARLLASDVRASGVSLMAGRLVSDAQASGVSVSVAAAVVTLRWTPGVGRRITAASDLATILPLSRACGLLDAPPFVDGC